MNPEAWGNAKSFDIIPQIIPVILISCAHELSAWYKNKLLVKMYVHYTCTSPRHCSPSQQSLSRTMLTLQQQLSTSTLGHFIVSPRGQLQPLSSNISSSRKRKWLGVKFECNLKPLSMEGLGHTDAAAMWALPLSAAGTKAKNTTEPA